MCVSVSVAMDADCVRKALERVLEALLDQLGPSTCENYCFSSLYTIINNDLDSASVCQISAGGSSRTTAGTNSNVQQHFGLGK